MIPTRPQNDPKGVQNDPKSTPKAILKIDPGSKTDFSLNVDRNWISPTSKNSKKPMEIQGFSRTGRFRTNLVFDPKNYQK